MGWYGSLRATFSKWMKNVKLDLFTLFKTEKHQLFKLLQNYMILLKLE